MLLREISSKKAKQSRILLTIIGVLSGFLCGLYGVGALLGAYIGRMTDDSKAFKGNICLVFVIENSFRIIMYSLYGIITLEALRTAAFLAPFMLVGLGAGMLGAEEKAEAALNSMMEIRQQRLDLLSGYQETNYSVEAFRYLASSLKQTEDSYLSMFIGSTSKNEHVHSFIFSPTADNVNKETSVLCFSEETGICSSTRNSNSQITISVIPRNQSVKKEPKLKENGIKYRIPVTAEIYARYKDKTYCGGIYQLPQLGKMMTFDMAKNKYVLYDSHTGSIRSIKVE